MWPSSISSRGIEGPFYLNQFAVCVSLVIRRPHCLMDCEGWFVWQRDLQFIHFYTPMQMDLLPNIVTGNERGCQRMALEWTAGWCIAKEIFFSEYILRLHSRVFFAYPQPQPKSLFAAAFGTKFTFGVCTLRGSLQMLLQVITRSRGDMVQHSTVSLSHPNCHKHSCRKWRPSILQQSQNCLNGCSLIGKNVCCIFTLPRFGAKLINQFNYDIFPMVCIYLFICPSLLTAVNSTTNIPLRLPLLICTIPLLPLLPLLSALGNPESFIHAIDIVSEGSI